MARPTGRRNCLIAGRTQSFSTGGLGYASFAGRLKEILQGQVLYLLKRSWRLLREARRADGIVVVGDVIPVILAWLSGKPVITYLVAYSSHYEGRLRLPWPCGPCLASKRFAAVFSRDALSASDLSEQLRRLVEFLGNPFMDGLVAADGQRSAPGGCCCCRAAVCRKRAKTWSACWRYWKSCPLVAQARFPGRLGARTARRRSRSLGKQRRLELEQQHQPQPLAQTPRDGAAVLLGQFTTLLPAGSGGGLDGGHRQRAGRRFGQASAAARRPWTAIHRGLC